jgi:hypothetical protein
LLQLTTDALTNAADLLLGPKPPAEEDSLRRRNVARSYGHRDPGAAWLIVAVTISSGSPFR